MPKIMTLICERSCELSNIVDSQSQLKDIPGCYVVKFPCSGMIQPLMIQAALDNGADGVVVTGCQIGDCYFREGNKMIRERLLGERLPTLKKNVDRRRILALWLSKVQPARLISEVKEFSSEVAKLPPPEVKPAAKPAPKPVPKPASVVEAKPEEVAEEIKPEAKPATVVDVKPEEAKVEAKPESTPEVVLDAKPEEKLES